MGVQCEELALESSVVIDQDPDDGAGVLVHGGLGRGLVTGTAGICTGDVGGIQSILDLPIGV